MDTALAMDKENIHTSEGDSLQSFKPLDIEKPSFGTAESSVVKTYSSFAFDKDPVLPAKPPSLLASSNTANIFANNTATVPTFHFGGAGTKFLQSYLAKKSDAFTGATASNPAVEAPANTFNFTAPKFEPTSTFPTVSNAGIEESSKSENVKTSIELGKENAAASPDTAGTSVASVPPATTAAGAAVSVPNFVGVSAPSKPIFSWGSSRPALSLAAPVASSDFSTSLEGLKKRATEALEMPAISPSPGIAQEEISVATASNVPAGVQGFTFKVSELQMASPSIQSAEDTRQLIKEIGTSPQEGKKEETITPPAISSEDAAAAFDSAPASNGGSKFGPIYTGHRRSNCGSTSAAAPVADRRIISLYNQGVEKGRRMNNVQNVCIDRTPPRKESSIPRATPSKSGASPAVSNETLEAKYGSLPPSQIPRKTPTRRNGGVVAGPSRASTGSIAASVSADSLISTPSTRFSEGGISSNNELFTPVSSADAGFGRRTSATAVDTADVISKPVSSIFSPLAPTVGGSVVVDNDLGAFESLEAATGPAVVADSKVRSFSSYLGSGTTPTAVDAVAIADSFSAYMQPSGGSLCTPTNTPSGSLRRELGSCARMSDVVSKMAALEEAQVEVDASESEMIVEVVESDSLLDDTVGSITMRKKKSVEVAHENKSIVHVAPKSALRMRVDAAAAATKRFLIRLFVFLLAVAFVSLYLFFEQRSAVAAGTSLQYTSKFH